MANSRRSNSTGDNTSNSAAGTEPFAERAGTTDAQRGRAKEAGLHTDTRGGPGSAARAGHENHEASPGDGLFDEESTEPRADTRIGKHSSQGLKGAQGSGGGAERGINQPPPRARPSDERRGSASPDADDAGIDPAGTGPGAR